VNRNPNALGSAPIPALSLCAALALVLSLAGCATALRIDASVDPLSILQSGSLVYARLSGAATREFARSALPAAEAEALAPVLDRTRVLALGLGGSGSGPDARAFQACLIGDYPFRSAALSLASNPAWKREKSSFYNSALGLRAAVPGPNLVLASSSSLDGLLAGARTAGPSPIPRRFADLDANELLFWLPEPFAGFGEALFGEAMDLPVTGLLLAASPREAGRSYEATIVFLMRDAASARIYRPVLRLAWRGMAAYLFGSGEGGPEAEFSVKDDCLSATRVIIPSSQLALAFSKLAGRAGEASMAK
jgi:hypothetical protein